MQSFNKITCRFSSILGLAVLGIVVGCSPEGAPTGPSAARGPANTDTAVKTVTTSKTMAKADSQPVTDQPTAIPATEIPLSEVTAKTESAPEQPAAPQPAARKSRQPIYNEKADARADIQAALQRAADDNKRVLVKFGGNWCGWCFKLHDVFHEDKAIAQILRNEYELVLVDVNNNRAIIEEYAPGESYGFPWLTVLDASGKVLCNQETGSLEIGPKHDPAKVKDFLVKWQLEPIAADQALAAGLERAKAENRRVLLHVGAPWCVWCHVFEAFLKTNNEVLGVDYVDVKIDQDRMTGGKELADRLRDGHTEGGIPWIAILDANGETLVTSDGPQGNIGHPGEPHEIEHFIQMVQKTRQKLTNEQVAALENSLRDDAAKRKSRR